MTKRAYTVTELDELRRAVEMRWLFGSSVCSGGISRGWTGSEKDHSVEELVRTHMLAGHTAEDLRKADRGERP